MNTFYRWKMKKWTALSFGVIFLLTLLSCSPKPIKQVSFEIPPEPEPKVTLGPGDVLDVKFFYAPELNENQTARPDGKITLQLIGDVDIRGKTPIELRDELVRLYTSHLKTPEVTVIVRSLNDQRVYVGGEVKDPSLIAMSGRLTVLEAIMQAGGFNLGTAILSDVVVIRQKDGNYYGTVLDLKKVLEGETSSMFYLAPRDIVYVPRATIADLNQWIDQYINRMIPQLGVTYSWPAGAGTVTIDTSPAVRP